jgi:hypothetical protein
MKGKVVPVLNHGDKRGSGGIAPPFLTSALDGDKWSALHSGHCTLGNEPLVPTH